MTDQEASHVAHHNLTLLTTDDKASMEAFLQEPSVRALVWKRLDDTHALVDSERIQLLSRRLKKLGYSPRFARLS